MEITEDNQTFLSFDNIFSDITEFRNSFLDYEQLIDEHISAINGIGAVLCEILERFDDNRLNSFNFFTRYILIRSVMLCVTIETLILILKANCRRSSSASIKSLSVEMTAMRSTLLLICHSSISSMITAFLYIVYSYMFVAVSIAASSFSAGKCCVLRCGGVSGDVSERTPEHKTQGKG